MSASDGPSGESGHGPVGEGEYLVQSGDCISSIAKTHGHFWETLWNDPANAKLKAARGNPNILFPGDRVTIPPIRNKVESRPNNARHRFVRKGVPSKFRLRLVAENREDVAASQGSPPRYEGKDVYSEDPVPDQRAVQERPRASVPYRIEIQGKQITGKTDGDGYLEVAIEGTEGEARLLLNPDTLQQEEFRIMLGHLDPIDEIVGVKQRLANLTFDCGDRSNEMTPGFREAIEAFQQHVGINVSGELTAEVRQKLRERHGS
jgi:Putative peptidoglycan binding domain